MRYRCRLKMLPGIFNVRYRWWAHNVCGVFNARYRCRLARLTSLTESVHVHPVWPA